MSFIHFISAYDLTVWVNDPAQANITIVSIVSDAANGGFTLFYR
jgi:hypothetical protein